MSRLQIISAINKIVIFVWSFLSASLGARIQNNLLKVMDYTWTKKSMCPRYKTPVVWPSSGTQTRMMVKGSSPSIFRTQFPHVKNGNVNSLVSNGLSFLSSLSNY